MLQYIFGIALVAGMVFLVGRFVWQKLTRKESCCNCGSPAGCCKTKSSKSLLVKIHKLQKSAPTSEASRI